MSKGADKIQGTPANARAKKIERLKLLRSLWEAQPEGAYLGATIHQFVSIYRPVH